jgi:hypothetical protein
VRRVVLTVLTLALAGGYFAATALPSSKPDTKVMVLQLRDLPTGFGLEKGHYVSNAEANRQATTKKDYARLGRITGYDAEYTKRGIAGLIQVDSTASLYKTARGARDSIRVSFRAADRGGDFKRLSVGAPIGNESRLYLSTDKDNGVNVDIYSVVWRSGPVYAAVVAGGLAGTVDAVDVVALARKQQARIARVLRSRP